MTSTFGNVAMQGFANGGLVGGNMFLDSRQIQKTIESSLEERVTSEVDDAINELRRRLGIEGKKDKREGETFEYPEYNKKRTGSGYKPATPGSFNVIEYITGDPSHANYKYDHGTVKNYHDHIAFATKEDKEGIELTLKSFESALDKFGMIPIYPVNEEFNPEKHEAVTMEQDKDKENGSIGNVFQRGWELHSRIVRPARVTVIKN